MSYVSLPTHTTNGGHIHVFYYYRAILGAPSLASPAITAWNKFQAAPPTGKPAPSKSFIAALIGTGKNSPVPGHSRYSMARFT